MPQDIDAAAIGHVDIQNDQVPMAVAELLQRFRAAASLGDCVNRTVLLQVMPEPGSHHRVIVSNKYARHTAPGSECCTSECRLNTRLAVSGPAGIERTP